MKKKILCAIFAILIIVDCIIIAKAGLKVDLNYGEGYTISFTENQEINLDDIKSIANEIWGKNCLVQKVEFFNDSASIKVKEYTDVELQTLCDKLNEKYSSEFEASNFDIQHVSNVKLRTLIEPYIAPVGISFLLILTYYAIRYRGARNMLNLVEANIVVQTILLSVYAIGRVKVGVYTLPIAMTAYIATILACTVYNEVKQKNK